MSKLSSGCGDPVRSGVYRVRAADAIDDALRGAALDRADIGPAGGDALAAPSQGVALSPTGSAGKLMRSKTASAIFLALGARGTCWFFARQAMTARFRRAGRRAALERPILVGRGRPFFAC